MSTPSLGCCKPQTQIFTERELKTPGISELSDWCKHISKLRVPILDTVKQRVDFAGNGIELGAGTCWLSSVLSRSLKVASLTAVDVDPSRLGLAKSFFIPFFKGFERKINLLVSDYHRLNFPDSFFDFAVCDASLHHAADLRRLLAEVRRVLKPSGILVAIREPVLPRAEPIRTWRRLTFGWSERRKGAIERTYTASEWNKFFEEAGFRAEFIEYFLDTTAKEKVVCLLRRWNGLLFSRYLFIARPLIGHLAQ